MEKKILMKGKVRFFFVVFWGDKKKKEVLGVFGFLDERKEKYTAQNKRLEGVLIFL